MTGRPSSLKPRLMVATIVVALLLAAGWSYLRLAEARDRAESAGADLAECRAVVARIENLRRRPAVAGAHAVGKADLSKRIEQAARAAEFADNAVELIAPEPASRVGETPYREFPTRVPLRGVTLRQLFTFLHSLCDNAAGTEGSPSPAALNVKSIRLSAPRGDESGDGWTVETTLTYIVFSPKGKTEPADGRNQLASP